MCGRERKIRADVLEVDRKLEGFYERLHAWLTESLENGASIGLLRRLDTVHVAWCIIGSVKQFRQLVLERPAGELDIAHLSQVILDFHLRGIPPPENRVDQVPSRAVANDDDPEPAARRAGDGYEAKYMAGAGEVLHRDKMVGGRGWRAALLGIPVGATIAASLPAVIADPSAVAVGFTIGGALLASVPYLLFSVLRVTVSTEHVHVQFGLWGPKIPIASIVECEVVSYDWKEYGGFGIKRSADGAWIYNMIGDAGRAVRIRWQKDGKERVHLVSSNHPEALAASIREARARADAGVAAPRVRVAEPDEHEVEVSATKRDTARRER